MTARGVLTSCATPAASRQMEESFSACESCDSSSIRSVISSTMIKRPMTLKSLVTSGAMAILATRASPAHGAEAGRIRAVLGDEHERVGRIAKHLGHLAALLVADDAGEINILERHRIRQRELRVAHEFVAGHDHARDPEE